MATTKKTVKTDATDKKSNATKKTTTTKKKTTKKKVESTGVVDEFLNENVGKVVTETETPKTEKKKTTKKKITNKKTKEPEVVENTDENKLMDAEAELNEILYQQHMEEVNKALEGDNKQNEEFKEKWEELGLTNELQADIQKIVSNLPVETKECDNTEDDLKNVVYPPIENNNETPEKEVVPNADSLKVNLEQKNEPQRFTYVHSFMGVKYD